ncbi:MAG: hypothetical protein FJ011_27220 [Chloroflexi bacterium]|nr:hypothetical protein [Chloroflexota bacterium]
MLTRKQVLCEERVRRVPRQFSWVDHRLVRDGFCRRCQPEELALYLLLITVGDAEGLSYYSDASMGRLLNLPAPRLPEVRDRLCRADLVAYRHPLYQVLELPEVRS